ncbi:MAG: VWA domain-containing protein [Gemmatimonadales bacterium]
MSRGFLVPLALALLLPWAAVVWHFHRREERARRAALEALGAHPVLARVGAIPTARVRRRSLALRAAAAALAIVALARPFVGTQEVSGARAGRDVLVALDLSRSMRVADASGTRLMRAKALLGEVANALPGDRLGLIIFGGAAFLQLPLTTDHAIFERWVEAASPEAIDDPGTDLLAAVQVAAKAFEHDANTGHRALLVVTDGERSEGALDEAVETAVKSGMPIFAIGVGTQQGAFVPPDSTLPADSGATWHLDNIGRPVISRLRAEELQRIAAATNGLYAQWDDPKAVATIAAGIQRLAARPLGVETQEEPDERFQWPLAFAILLLAADLLRLPLPRLRALRPAAFALLPFLTSCIADWPALSRAASDYEAGRFEEARDAWQQVLAHRDDPKVRYNLGNAQYRMNRYEEAAESYRKTLATTDTALRHRALMNLGNAYVRAAEDAPDKSDFLQRAVTTFEAALVLSPADQDAKWNLEIALRKQADVESGGSPGRGGRAQAGQGSGGEEGLDSQRETAVGAMAGGGQGDAGGESAEELSVDDARKLLEAIEREQLTSHEARPAVSGGRAGRDW